MLLVLLDGLEQLSLGSIRKGEVDITGLEGDALVPVLLPQGSAVSYRSAARRQPDLRLTQRLQRINPVNCRTAAGGAEPFAAGSGSTVE